MKQPNLSPVHIEAVGMANVRYFAPPAGRGNLPWVAVDDLFGAMRLPRRARLGFKSDLRNDPAWKKALSRIFVGGYAVEVMPNWAAMGFLTALNEKGHVTVADRDAYISGSLKATDLLASLAGADRERFFADGLAHDFQESKPEVRA